MAKKFVEVAEKYLKERDYLMEKYMYGF